MGNDCSCSEDVVDEDRKNETIVRSETQMKALQKRALRKAAAIGGMQIDEEKLSMHLARKQSINSGFEYHSQTSLQK